MRLSCEIKLAACGSKFIFLWWKLQWPLWGADMEVMRSLEYMSSLSAVNNNIQKIQSITSRDGFVATAVLKLSVLTANRPRDYTTAIVFTVFWIWPQEFPSFKCTVSWTVELHLPETAGYEDPDFQLRPFSELELDFGTYVIYVYEYNMHN